MVGGLIDCDIHTVTVMVTVHLSCHLFFGLYGVSSLIVIGGFIIILIYAGLPAFCYPIYRW